MWLELTERAFPKRMRLRSWLAAARVSMVIERHTELL
jgi:hypothetical protein